MTPPMGESIWWRPRDSLTWSYGWVSDAGAGLIRLGWYYGCTTSGAVVDPDEIEWRAKR